MLENFLSLPYVHVWLPLVLAVLVGTPVYLLALRPPRRLAEGPPGGRAVEGPPEEVDPFAVGSTSEQRKAFRRLGNPIEVLYAAPEQAAAPGRGYVLDRSVGGLRLMLPHAQGPGAALKVRPANASTMVPWVDLEVRCCAESKTQPGAFDVGCAFVKAPPYPILLLFG